MKKYNPYTFTMNENGNIEMRIVTDGEPIYIQAEERDIKSMKDWFDIKRMMDGEK